MNLKGEEPIEYGVIATLRKRFGFIKCCNRNLDLFFHFNDVKDGLCSADLKEGTEVSFTPTHVVQTDGSTRLVAKKVGNATGGMIVFNTVSQQQMLGLIVELPQTT
jgi:cold shock CspA family protein